MLSLCVTFSVLAGCQTTKVSDENIPVITDERMVEALKDEKAIVVDVRKPENYAAGHIPGAINIYLPDIRQRDPRLTPKKRIIIYAADPSDPFGIAAAKRMVALGYSGVEEYKGGLERWKQEGRQVSTTISPDQTRQDTAR